MQLTVQQRIDMAAQAHAEGRSNGAGEDRIEEAARAAMREHEIARTDVVRPVNGSAAYTVVIFHGRRIEFHDDDWTIEQHRDAGSSKAATYAQAINGGLFDLAKGAATAALSAPQGELERLRAALDLDWLDDLADDLENGASQSHQAEAAIDLRQMVDDIRRALATGAKS